MISYLTQTDTERRIPIVRGEIPLKTKRIAMFKLEWTTQYRTYSIIIESVYELKSAMATIRDWMVNGVTLAWHVAELSPMGSILSVPASYRLGFKSCSWFKAWIVCDMLSVQNRHITPSKRLRSGAGNVRAVCSIMRIRSLHSPALVS